MHFVVAHLVQHRGVLDLQQDEAKTVLVGCQIERVGQDFLLEFQPVDLLRTDIFAKLSLGLVDEVTGVDGGEPSEE